MASTRPMATAPASAAARPGLDAPGKRVTFRALVPLPAPLTAVTREDA